MIHRGLVLGSIVLALLVFGSPSQAYIDLLPEMQVQWSSNGHDGDPDVPTNVVADQAEEFGGKGERSTAGDWWLQVFDFLLLITP